MTTWNVELHIKSQLYTSTCYHTVLINRYFCHSIIFVFACSPKFPDSVCTCIIMNTLFSLGQYSIKYFSVLYLSVRKPVHDLKSSYVYIYTVYCESNWFSICKDSSGFWHLFFFGGLGGGPSEGLFICPDSGNEDGTACTFFIFNLVLFFLLQIPVISVPTVSFQNIDFSAISLKFLIQWILNDTWNHLFKK